MKVAIAGYGLEGRAAAGYYRKLGNDVTILDAQEDILLPPGVEGRLGAKYLDHLDDFDLIVRTAGLKPKLLKTSKPISSSTREFFARCPAPIIGITGTKGKGTTSTLIARMLEAAGKKVFLGGNIGVPALSFLSEITAGDIVVLELSSFQLMDIEQSPATAVVLMISPDHQDWHDDMAEYVAAKARLVRYQQPGDRCIFNARNALSSKIAQTSPGQRVPYMDPAGCDVTDGQITMAGIVVCSVAEVGLIGPHNLENICAAVAAIWPLIDDKKVISKVIKSFKGLPHRLELVGEAEGVRYFDDSFSTNPETTMAAIQSFADPKVLILGGSDKGADFSQLAEAVKSGNVRQVIAIGATAPAIASSLRLSGFNAITEGPADMPAILKAAQNAALPGDIVLLSPGCASFGLFQDYKDRGNQFKAAVSALVVGKYNAS